jgi:hypothetical protein
MRAFAHSPSVFSATCAAILARMLNTVPRAVTLTDIIVPQAVKPDSVSLVRLRNGGFSLGGAVRVSPRAASHCVPRLTPCAIVLEPGPGQ